MFLRDLKICITERIVCMLAENMSFFVYKTISKLWQPLHRKGLREPSVSIREQNGKWETTIPDTTKILKYF